MAVDEDESTTLIVVALWESSVAFAGVKTVPFRAKGVSFLGRTEGHFREEDSGRGIGNGSNFWHFGMGQFPIGPGDWSGSFEVNIHAVAKEPTGWKGVPRVEVIAAKSSRAVPDFSEPSWEWFGVLVVSSPDIKIIGKRFVGH